MVRLSKARNLPGYILKKLLNPISLIWIVVLIILFPVLKPGFFSFHDETHIVDVYQMIRSIELGGFPPRFAPDFNFGLGHPYFNFYYHLPFYVTTVLHYVGFSMTDSFKYMLGLAVILSASGFYLFLRNHFGKTASVFGTLVYILSPYFAVDLYVRGGAGEMYIFALFPWAGFFLYRYLQNPGFSNLAPASIAIFLLGISHNVLLPFVYGFLFLYGLSVLFMKKPGFINYFKICFPFFLGILLAAYYLLPALTEVKFIATYEQINIADHFPFIKQLIIPHWGYGPSIWGYLDDFSFDIGTINLVFLVISLVVFKWLKKEHKILLIFFWAVFLIAVVLMNSRTLFFWESIRFLRLVQFPWRMLLLTTISSAFIAGLVVDLLSEKFKKITPAFLITVFITLIALNIWHYHPSEYKYVSDERYLELYFADRTLLESGERGYLSKDYLNFTEDFIPPTIWAQNRPKDLERKVYFASDSGTVDFKAEGLGYEINYASDKDDKIVVRRAYFPGWEANSAGQKINVEAFSTLGMLAVPVSEGSGSIKVQFKNTPIRFIANSISAVAGVIILVLLTYQLIRRKND